MSALRKGFCVVKNILFDDNKRTLKYIISGILGVVGNIVAFYVATEIMGLWYLFSSFLSFLAALLITFLCHKYWTFADVSGGAVKKQSVLYTSSATGVLVLNIILLFLLVDMLGVPALFAQIFALGFLSFGSFVFTTQITFSKEGGENAKQMLHEIKDAWSAFVETHWFFIAILILVGAVNVYLRMEFFPLTLNGDGIQFVETAQHFVGEDAPIHPHRVLKPLAPIGIALLAPIFGYVGAFQAEVVIFYFLLAIVTYLFAHLIVQDKKQAFAGALLYITSYPMLRYGIDLFTETGAWFFYVAGLYGALLFYKTLSNKALTWSLVAIFLGIMWKEYAVLAGVVLATILLIHPRLTVKQKMKKIIVSSLLFFPPLILWLMYVAQVYDFTYIDWLKIGHSNPPEESQYKIFYIAKSMFGLFLLGWGFVLLGLYKIKEWTREQKWMVGLFTVPSFGFFLWGFVSSRLYYVLATLLAVCAAKGFGFVKRRWLRVGSLVFVVLINYGWLFISYNSEVRAFLNSF